jgi:hypothetical protein
MRARPAISHNFCQKERPVYTACFCILSGLNCIVFGVNVAKDSMLHAQLPFCLRFYVHYTPKEGLWKALTNGWFFGKFANLNKMVFCASTFYTIVTIINSMKNSVSSFTSLSGNPETSVRAACCTVVWWKCIWAPRRDYSSITRPVYIAAYIMPPLPSSTFSNQGGGFPKLLNVAAWQLLNQLDMQWNPAPITLVLCRIRLPLYLSFTNPCVAIASKSDGR